MATHSSVLAWRIPGTREPGGLPSMGSQSRTRLKRHSGSRGFPGGASGKESAYSSADPGWFLDWEYPLEKEMATYFTILAWRIPCTEEPGRLQSAELQELDATE